uniref:Centrosomal protein 72 n=1 Tax=Sus scrofa TaxID=9823 RepID=A0A287AET6_PIG
MGRTCLRVHGRMGFLSCLQGIRGASLVPGAGPLVAPEPSPAFPGLPPALGDALVGQPSWSRVTGRPGAPSLPREAGGRVPCRVWSQGPAPAPWPPLLVSLASSPPDDRPVRERERTASQLRFALEESPDLKQSFPAVFRVERRCPSRAKGPDPSAKKCLVMDADDEAVLNLIAECEWDLSNPPGSMSSSQREPEASVQSSHESQHVSSPRLVQQQCGDSLRKGPEKRRSPLPRTGGAGPRLWDLRPPRCLPASPEATDSEDSASSSQKSSLSTQKALDPLPAPEKFRKRRMPGGSFQTPADQESLSCLGEGLGRRNGSGGWSQSTVSHSAALVPEPQRPPSESEVCPRLPFAVAPGKRPALEGLLLEALLDLVDRYWSGCRSLHGNELFLAQARHILSSLQEVTAAQDSSTTVSEEIGYLTLENKSLHSHLGELQRQCGAKLSEVVLELGSTRKEMVADQCEEAFWRDRGAEAAPGALRQAPGAHPDAAGEPQVPGQHQRAAPAGAGPGAGAAPGRGGAAALELPRAQEDHGPVPRPPRPRPRPQPRGLLALGSGPTSRRPQRLSLWRWPASLGLMS